MASSLFFSAYEKLLLLPLLSRTQGIPHRIFVSRCRPTTALRAPWRDVARPRRDGRDTLHGDVGCCWLAGVLDGAPQRNQLAPGHGLGPGSRCTHCEHCRCTRGGCICITSCARALERLKRSCLRDLYVYMCVCTVAEYVAESSTCFCVRGPSCSRRTFVLIKETSKLKVMICRNILVLALLSRCPTREMEPLRCLMPHLLAVWNPACSCGACLQCSIYIKRKDILSSLRVTTMNRMVMWSDKCGKRYWDDQNYHNKTYSISLIIFL